MPDGRACPTPAGRTEPAAAAWRIRKPDPASGAADAAAIRTQEELEALERDNLLRALEASHWRISGERGAATLLRMNPSTLRSRMKALGIKSPA